MQDERDAPFLRISATTGTTEQLQSGTGTPSAALVLTDFRLSCFNHRRMASRDMKTCISPERNNPSNSMGDKSRKDAHRKPKNPASSPLGSIGTVHYPRIGEWPRRRITVTLNLITPPGNFPGFREVIGALISIGKRTLPYCPCPTPPGIPSDFDSIHS